MSILVLAILVSLGVPFMQESIARQRGRGAVEGLRAALQWGRSEALKQNVPVYFSINPSQPWCAGLSRGLGCGCGVACPAPGALITETLGDQFPGVSVASATFAGSLCGSVECVRFEPQRGTAQGSNGTVVLESGVGARYRIIVAGLGRVRVCVEHGDAGAPWPPC
ncbi:MAG: GspH/FimT family pseudopilin [Zoogloeaceae bacterium]|nr:GspH/FimT family pseudopilin [Zoogloeaceae bacterium]